MPSFELAKNIRISSVTTRILYPRLREALAESALMEPMQYGGAGFFLFEGMKLSSRGKRLIAELMTREVFQRHLKHQYPRGAGREQIPMIAFEVAVRLFCQLDMHKDESTLYPPKTRKALRELEDIRRFLNENIHKEGFAEKHANTINHFRTVSQKMSLLLSKEELLSLQKHSKIHRYSNDVLYNDLRSHLLKKPLGWHQ